MINLTKINDTEIMINEDYIQTIEEAPDSVITFTDGKKIIVKETKKTIYELILEFKRKIK